MKQLLLTSLVVFVLIGTPHAFSQDLESKGNGTAQSDMMANLGSLNVEIVVGADYGWPTRLIIRGRVNQPKAWLGLSFYPYNVDDAVTGGSHRFIELEEGSFSHEIPIESQFLGGSFESALWATRVDKVDSTEEYSYWDKMFGYHVDDLIAYKSGLLTQLDGYR
jgi:hypothetical protein